MDRQQMADVLASAWVLATAREGRSARPLPTGQGILDRALRKAICAGHFPSEFQRLRFIDTRLGTRCPELRAILTWTQAAEQSTDPNPSYRETDFEFTPETAETVLAELGVNPVAARGWGEALANAIDEELADSAALA